MTAALAHWLAPWRVRARGMLLVSVLALVGVLAAHVLSAPLTSSRRTVLSPVLFAILLGMVWRHWRGVADRSRPGVEWIAQTLLRIGIALVGLQLTLAGVESVVGLALPVVAACITVSLVVSTVVGRWLNVPISLRSLLAVGSAVCGCTAIAATAPVIRARAEEVGAALCCVVLIGGTGMLVYPWLAHELFATNPRAAAVFLGTSIHDTSQVVGAALLYEQHFDVAGTTAMASATKLFRNLSLLLLVPVLAAISKGGGEQVSATDRPRVADVMPGFIVVFIGLAMLRFVADTWLIEGSAARQMWQAGLDISSKASSWLIVGGMCAVGLGVSVRSITRIGGRVVLLAVTTAVAIAITSVSVLLILT